MTRDLHPHFNHRGRWTCSDGWDFETHRQALKHEKILAARAVAEIARAVSLHPARRLAGKGEEG